MRFLPVIGLVEVTRILLSTFGLVLMQVIGVDEVLLVEVAVPFTGLVLVLRVFFCSTFGLVLLQVIGVGGFGSLKSKLLDICSSFFGLVLVQEIGVEEVGVWDFA